MLMHPGMRRLQAFGTAGLTGSARRRTAAHVADCAECQRTLSWMDAVRDAAAVDAPAARAGSWDAVAARVAAQEVVLLPVEEPQPVAETRRGGVRAGLRVAAVALLVAAGAAAAMPESWRRSVIEALLPARDAIDDPAAMPSATPAAALHPVLLFVEPANGSLQVVLDRPHPGVRIHVQLVDTDELEVRALDGAAAATFRTSPGRIEIVNADSGAVMLAVPMSLGRIRIVVEGRTLLLKERGEIRILAPMADTIGSEFILPVRQTGAATPPR